MDILNQWSDIIKEKNNRLYSILKKNKDNLLNPNNSIIVVTVIIKVDIE